MQRPVLIEGEEEIGSPTLHTFLESHIDELRSDVLVLADAGNSGRSAFPGSRIHSRGLAAADVELRLRSRVRCTRGWQAERSPTR